MTTPSGAAATEFSAAEFSATGVSAAGVSAAGGAALQVSATTGLEPPDQMVPQVHRLTEGLQAECVVARAGHVAQLGDRAGRQHETVPSQVGPVLQRHRARLQVDRLHEPVDQLCPGAERARPTAMLRGSIDPPATSARIDDGPSTDSTWATLAP